MFRPDPRVVTALEDLAQTLPEDAATEVEAAIRCALAAKRPDLTDVLLVAARHEPRLGAPLLGAACRAVAARLATLHPGGTVELRVPPFTAVQLGFGDGPRHTRGTPPNVVELDATTLLDLTVGRTTWAEARPNASGVHAHRLAEVFPLPVPSVTAP